MGTQKVSLTLPDELLARAKAAVDRGEVRSISAYIAAAAGSGEERATWNEVRDRWAAAHGEATAEQKSTAEERARAFFERTDNRLHGAA